MEKQFTLLLSLSCLLLLARLDAQTNVRGWYADGQVWIVWEASEPLPETYAVYGKPAAFSSTSDAIFLGRLFKEEFGPGALREQIDTTATYRIPDGQGGLYQLADNEALFVATPHQAGALWVAVVPGGETTVTAGINLTAGAVPFQYNPAGDPVECHLQAVFPSPFAAGFTCFAYYLWADGRQNQWENRPDFPVMANAAKNGMPSMFLVSVPTDLDTTGGIPLSVWLHGGGGTARQSLAGSRAVININPEKGILLAHNDDLFGKLLTFYSGFDSASKHFGWRKNYDPFTGEAPVEPDTIVNYTQRRYFWIDQWLARNFNIDTTRININGHSMGSRGATMMAKAFPNHYASATILNNGFVDTDPPALVDVAFGPTALSFPTNLKDYDGQTVHYSNMMDLTLRLSSSRDLPLLRSFHGKNDTGGSNEWDATVVEQYCMADSLGWGAQLYWSEREHGPETGPEHNDHWLNGNLPTQQTIVDNVAFEENFRSDASFPAFFNHRLDAQNNDPGDGTPGTGPNGVGDDWGTWGGYHRWDWNNLTDLPGAWSAVAWLESNAIFDHDNCPVNMLTADLAIRKPQQFKPVPGTVLNWNVIDTNNGNILQNGTTTVRADGLVAIPQIEVFRETLRKVRISIFDPLVDTKPEPATLFGAAGIQPNPSGASTASLVVSVSTPMSAVVRVNGISGRGSSSFVTALAQGENRIPLSAFEHLPAGVYGVEIYIGEDRTVLKWVKI